MMTWRNALLLLAGMTLLNACRTMDPDNAPVTHAEMKTLTQQSNQDLLDRVKLASMQFYEETADAYFILGYEYNNLHQDMLKSGKKDQAAQYERLAKIYYDQQKDLETLAERARQGLSPKARAALEPVSVMAPASQPAAAVKTVSASSRPAAVAPAMVKTVNKQDQSTPTKLASPPKKVSTGSVKVMQTSADN